MTADRDLDKAITTAGVALAFSGPGIASGWIGKLKPLMYADPKVADVCITAKGVAVNPERAKEMTPGQLVFKLAAQTMKVALDHPGLSVSLGLRSRDGEQICTDADMKAFGLASDLATNTPLVKDKIGAPPADVLTLESLQEKLKPDAPRFEGRFTAADLFYHIKEWLKEEEKDDDGDGPGPGGDPGGDPGGGEGEPDPNNPQTGEGNYPEGDMSLPQSAKDEMREMMRSIGKGSFVAESMEPPPVRSTFEKVITAGATEAEGAAGARTLRTYARTSRRQNMLEPSVIMAGKIATEATLCIMVDASGSVSRESVARAAAHTLKVQRSFPTMKVYFITHTSDICWQGWLKKGGDPKAIADATAHSGGTSCETAYAAVREVAPRGGFDVMIHFTDAELGGEWPIPAARKFVVGLCGRAGLDPENLYTKPPTGAKIVPVGEEQAS